MLYAVVAVIALILDQLLKYWTTVSLVVDTGRKNLIPGVIHLTNVRNTGAAFSFLQGARWFFVALCAVFVIAVIYMLLREIIHTPRARWCAVIVMAGAIGNCIDRVLNGYVVDMLEFDFKIFGMSFPVFNLADIYITVGVILFCIFLLTEKPQAEKNAAPAEGPAGATPAGKPKPVARILPAEAREEKTSVPSESGKTPAPLPQPVPREVRKTEEQAETLQKTAPIPIVPATVQAAGHIKPEPQDQTAVPPEKPHGRGRSSLAAERIEGMGQRGEKTKTEQVMRVLVNGNPAPAENAPAQAPVSPPTPVPAPKPSATGLEDEVSYDLDDILAEFRDL